MRANYFKKLIKDKAKKIKVNSDELYTPKIKPVYIEEEEVDLTAFFYELIAFLLDSDKEFVFNYLNNKIKRTDVNRIRFCRLKKIITKKIKLWDSLEK
jgi:hypothetical protein